MQPGADAGESGTRKKHVQDPDTAPAKAQGAAGMTGAAELTPQNQNIQTIEQTNATEVSSLTFIGRADRARQRTHRPTKSPTKGKGAGPTDARAKPGGIKRATFTPLRYSLSLQQGVAHLKG